MHVKREVKYMMSQITFLLLDAQILYLCETLA